MSLTALQQRKNLRSDACMLVATCAGWNSRLAARRITLFLDREVAECGADHRSEVGAPGLEASIPIRRKAHAKLERRLSPDLAGRLADETEALIRD